ncbi:Putative integral membrane protein [Helicobacter mustelae]|uniref:RDD family protein n=1 Tax=Helicobacter mustelae TaxID=217 RepID=UPI000DFD1883|nr:RDD family protein [Helicobacter mustelae]STP12847.1 Putative integral membrane protein [Helicobacter mustelae]
MFKTTLQKALILPRIKAFVTDLFMIYTPILYVMTYFVLDGAKSFQNNQSAIFLCVFLYGMISSSFLATKAQTPGFKYAQIKLIDLRGGNVGFLRAFARFLLWLLSMALVIGFVFPFFTRNHQCLHDVLCKTKIILQPRDLTAKESGAKDEARSSSATKNPNAPSKDSTISNLKAKNPKNKGSKNPKTAAKNF